MNEDLNTVREAAEHIKRGSTEEFSMTKAEEILAALDRIEAAQVGRKALTAAQCSNMAAERYPMDSRMSASEKGRVECYRIGYEHALFERQRTIYSPSPAPAELVEAIRKAAVDEFDLVEDGSAIERFMSKVISAAKSAATDNRPIL